MGLLLSALNLRARAAISASLSAAGCGFDGAVIVGFLFGFDGAVIVGFLLGFDGAVIVGFLLGFESAIAALGCFSLS